VAEAALVAAFAPSRRLDAYSTARLRAMESQLSSSGQGDDERTARELGQQNGCPVVVVNGRVESMGDALTLTIHGSSLGPGGVTFDGSETARTGAAIVDAAASLAGRLRSAMNDEPESPAEREVKLSSSLDALHEWIVGVALRLSGDYAGALPHLRSAVAIDPSFSEAHAALGLTLYDLVKFTFAATELDLALRDANGLPQRRRLELLSDRYSAEGRFAESIAASEQLLSRWPGDLSTEVSVTATAIDAGDWPLSLELGKRAVADHPRMLIARANLVAAELGNEAIEDARRDGDGVLAEFENPTAFAVAFAAIAHALSGDRERALSIYDRVAEKDPCTRTKVAPTWRCTRGGSTTLRS
jgi:hypothetical protein